MNDSDLENQLRALRPAAPSAALENRIASALAALSASPAPVRESLLVQILRPLFWATAGAAAAFAVMTLKTPPPATAPQLAATQLEKETPAFSPPETTRELLAAEQSDVRYAAGLGPVRAVRANYLEHHTWTDPHTGTRVEIAIPREDVFLHPIAMQ